MKSAFVTGVTGQDGAYLSQILLQNGYKVYGGVRNTSPGNCWRLERLNISNDIEFVDLDLLDLEKIDATVKSIKPNEFYNLAAQSFVGASFDRPMYTASTTGLSVLAILNAIKEFSPDTKFYQASTSEMFGQVTETPQKETTSFHPRSPYGVAKLFGHWSTINYRESYNLFASTGILFNHESPLRGEEYVTRKIIKGLVALKNGKINVLELGNLDVIRDWGFAGDFCRGIYSIMNYKKPDDFILATGESHSIREFAETACRILDFEFKVVGQGKDMRFINKKTGKTIIQTNPKFYRPCEVDMVRGDASKAQKLLGWKPEVNFEKIIKMMIDEELKYS